MQLSTLTTVLLYAYVLWGLFGGAVDSYGLANTSAAEKARILTNIQGATLYLAISLGVLLLTLTILYYDEESLGYALVAAAVFFYLGIPFLFDQVLSDTVKNWDKNNNVAAMAVMSHFRLAGLMIALPGGILMIRDVMLRLFDGSRRKKEEFSAMEYGGSVREEEPPKGAPIGMFAKCWQMVYCRDAIRKRCPIYLARTKCWRERVGCMCEENVIRHAMDAIINKEVISFNKPKEEVEGIGDSGIAGGVIAPEKTEEMPIPANFESKVPPRQVKIPYNPTLPMFQKKERCRNCVIYNEHQRLKYQFLSPLFVLAVPGLAIWQFDKIAGLLNRVLATLDNVMNRLSLDPNAHNGGIASSLTSTSIFAQYMVLGCLIIIATTMALRFLEYIVFKVKI